MTAYLISLALAGLVTIIVWEGLSWAPTFATLPGAPRSFAQEIQMPRAITEIRSVARSHTRKAINVLVGIMRSEAATAAARVTAANAILDRGWGKPPQSLQNGDGGALELIHRIERVIVSPENSDGKDLW
jgi:hypothetical protein